MRWETEDRETGYRNLPYRETVKNPDARPDYGIRYPVYGLADKKGDIPCDLNM